MNSPSSSVFLGVAMALGLLCLPYCHSWMPSSHNPNTPISVSPVGMTRSSSSTGRRISWSRMRTAAGIESNLESAAGEGIQMIDLANGRLDADHDVEGQLLADSIVRWLDAEWMPQEVHVQMAISVKNSYVRCRDNARDDVSDIMMQIATDLDENWRLYDKDAFVNAWEIGNYAADYLTKKSGNEGCACSAEIF
jgi:hypothetical protein